MTDSINPDQFAANWLKSLKKQGGKWQLIAKMLAFLQAACIIAQAWLLAYLLHQIIISHQTFAALKTGFVAALAAVVARYLCAWARESAAARASVLIQQDIRQTLLARLEALGSAWRSKQHGGELVSQLQEQVGALDGYLAKYQPQMALVMAVPIFILLAIFPQSWMAALIFVFTAPLIPIFMILVGLKAKEKQTEQQQQLARMSGHFLDQLRGLDTLQLFNRHQQQIEVIGSVAETFRQRTMAVLRLAFLSSTVLEFFTSVSIALVAVYLGFSFLGYFNFGVYGAVLSLHLAFFILLLAPEFYQPLRDLGTFYHAKAEAQAAASALAPWFLTPSPQLAGANQDPPQGAQAIRLQNASFAYHTSSVFENADLTLPAGKVTALIGQSGSGKTTLLRLLLGQLALTDGQIWIGDTELSQLDIQKWRAQIGWMGQSVHLFADTLRANLLIGNAHASDAELLQALTALDLKTWFDALPQGLDTILGEGGRGLSGGQLRRLGLARLWLSRAQILFFDEPTASLDESLEAQLLVGLQKLCAHKTVLLLTHRQAPLQLADKIIQIKNGQFCEVGDA